MRTEARILINNFRVPEGPHKLLDPLKCGSDVAEIEEGGFTIVTLDERDERLARLLGLLKKRGISWLERRYDCFTDEELEAARLLLMAYDVNATVFGGPRMGTTYDMSEACKRCGAGARQTSAMIIEGGDLHKLEGRRAASTCYHDMLVDEQLAGKLAESDLTGTSFRGLFVAFEKKGHMQLPWRQLCATHTLPPMSPRSTGIVPEEPCPCGRTGFDMPSEVPTRFVYRASDLADIRDVNVTWEWFGDAHYEGDVNEALLPYPFFLVTPKVWRIFRDAGVTGFDWMPIRVEEG